MIVFKSKTFTMQYKINGLPTNVHFGHFPLNQLNGLALRAKTVSLDTVHFSVNGIITYLKKNNFQENIILFYETMKKRTTKELVYKRTDVVPV